MVQIETYHIGITLIVSGAVLVVIAGTLALLNNARSLVNLFVPSCLRVIKEGFFTTDIGADVIYLLGLMLVVYGTIAII